MFREEHGLVVAGLARYLGDLELAEDALQDACVAALGAWIDGIPRNPAAWLTTTARRKAVDRIRRTRNLQRKYETIARELDQMSDELLDEDVIGDDRLRLIFTCCHPSLARPARIALTLKTVGGLTTEQIAHAFLVTEATMAQRIVRAKRKIRDAGIPYRVPSDADLPDRLDGVLEVIYLVYNEGYAASTGNQVYRSELTAEALRLVRILDRLLPHEAETLGLISLMLYQESRAGARTDSNGAVVLLGDQDRDLWDTTKIAEANSYLDRALTRERPGPYQIQAAISAVHADADSSRATDWPQIVALYGSLKRHDNSPIVTLNQAVAVAMASGPRAGLAMIDEINGLDDYVYYHSTRAALLADAHDDSGSRTAYERALEVATSDAQREFLRGKLAT